MGENTLVTNYGDGDDIEADHTKQYATALDGTITGRRNGVPVGMQDLGTPERPFNNLHIRQIFLEEGILDTAGLVSNLNGIISCRTRQLSEQPDFLRIVGSNQIRLLAEDIPLIVSVDGRQVTKDENEELFTTVSSSDNVHCRVDSSDAGRGGGEVDYVLPNGSFGEIKISYSGVTGDGSEIKNRVGQYAGFTIGNEILFAYIRDENTLTNVIRGFPFISGGSSNSESRQNLPHDNLDTGNQLRVLNTQIVFNTGALSKKFPVFGPIEPDGEDGDYWFDTTVSRWRRHDGTAFNLIDVVEVAVVFSHDTGVLGYRCFDLNKNFSNENNVRLEVVGGKVRVKNEMVRISIYGRMLELRQSNIVWDKALNLTDDVSLSQSNSYHYLYLDQFGRPYVSGREPYLDSVRKGYYHRFHTWRCVGRVLSNGANNAFVDTLFMWEKYNPTGVIPLEFGARITLNGSFGGTTTYTTESDYNILNPIPEQASSTISNAPPISIKSNVFKSSPRAYATLNNQVSVAISQQNAVATVGGTFEITGTTATRISIRVVGVNSRGQIIFPPTLTMDVSLLIKRSGADLQQTLIDNTLKGQ